MTARRINADNNAAASTNLPYAVDASMSLSKDELSVLQDQYLTEQDKGFISTQTKFNLAWSVTVYGVASLW